MSENASTIAVWGTAAHMDTGTSHPGSRYGPEGTAHNSRHHGACALDDRSPEGRSHDGRSRVPERRPTPWTVTIDHRCTACGACLSTCPEHALVPAAQRPLVLDARCTGCGECVEICPRGAISDQWGR